MHGLFLCEFLQNRFLLNRSPSRQMFIMHNPNAQTHVFEGRVCGLPCVPQMLDPSNPEQCGRDLQVWPFSVNSCLANPPQQMLRSHTDSSNPLTLSLGFPTNEGTAIYLYIKTFFVESCMWHSVLCWKITRLEQVDLRRWLVIGYAGYIPKQILVSINTLRLTLLLCGFVL